MKDLSSQRGEQHFTCPFLESLLWGQWQYGDSIGYSNSEVRCLGLETGARAASEMQAGFWEERDLESTQPRFQLPVRHPSTGSHPHPPCGAGTPCWCRSRAGGWNSKASGPWSKWSAASGLCPAPRCLGRPRGCGMSPEKQSGWPRVGEVQTGWMQGRAHTQHGQQAGRTLGWEERRHGHPRSYSLGPAEEHQTLGPGASKPFPFFSPCLVAYRIPFS